MSNVTGPHVSRGETSGRSPSVTVHVLPSGITLSVVQLSPESMLLLPVCVTPLPSMHEYDMS